MRLHYFQHVPFENPGYVLSWAGEHGYTVTRTLLYAAETPPAPDAYDWLVVMGGPMNIYEEDRYPWLAAEKRQIRAAIEAGKTVIGLCLGGQLIADVIGGRVTRSPYPEIGWLPVTLTETARQSPFFSFLPPEPVVFQWHGDTFSELPEEAVPLASSEVCAHQAFCYRGRVFGFQFHMENTPEIVRGLVEHCRGEMVPGPYVQTPEEVLSHPEHIARNNRWVAQFLNALLETEGQKHAANPVYAENLHRSAEN